MFEMGLTGIYDCLGKPSIKSAYFEYWSKMGGGRSSESLYDTVSNISDNRGVESLRYHSIFETLQMKSCTHQVKISYIVTNFLLEYLDCLEILRVYNFFQCTIKILFAANFKFGVKGAGGWGKN